MMPASVSGRMAFFCAIMALALTFVGPTAAADPSTVKVRKDSAVDSEPRDANYWFQKGALCATYGNNRAAVRYFSQAIALNPNHSGAYFSQGVAYGQMGDFARALADINRAIEMESRNGLYFYGRGRTYLLAGEKEKALQDFRTAAALRDEDAQAYLKNLK